MLSESELKSLQRDGYLLLPDATTSVDIATIRAHIDGLFNNLRSLPAYLKADLSKTAASRTWEVNCAVTLKPALRQSEFYRRALRISKTICGEEADYVHDHAICKPAHTSGETPWHQDEAGSYGSFLHVQKVHWWLPLQSANESSGALQFVRGSHKGPLHRHYLRSTEPSLQLEILRSVDHGDIVRPCYPLGAASIHLPRTLHYSGPNESDHSRIAWVIQFGVVRLPRIRKALSTVRLLLTRH